MGGREVVNACSWTQIGLLTKLKLSFKSKLSSNSAILEYYKHNVRIVTKGNFDCIARLIELQTHCISTHCWTSGWNWISFLLYSCVQTASSQSDHAHHYQLHVRWLDPLPCSSTWFTFNISSNGVEAGNLHLRRAVAPENAVLRACTHTSVHQVLLVFTPNLVCLWKIYPSAQNITFIFE